MGFERRSPEGMTPAMQQAQIDTVPPPEWPGAASADRTGAQLVILWSAREPERIGERAHCHPSRRHILGRAPQLQAGEDALQFLAERPEPGEPGERRAQARGQDLQGEALSRRQLEFGWDGSALTVRNIGRCPLWISGLLQGKARLHVGDTLHLQNQLVLLVARGEPAPVAGLSGAQPPAFGTADSDGLVGESPALWRLRQQIAQHGPSEDHVLCIGPSGAGKELVAQALVRHSARASRPLISENVATLPSSLAATQLFGNRRNFPNPGMEERPGLIGLAENGTLFLDEIGDMSSEVQPLLLRVMERSGEYLRIGDEAKPRRAHVRFIAATNHPERLRPELRRRFPREIHLPGLEARAEDIPLLARHLLLRQLGGRAELQRFVQNGQLRMDPRLVEQLVRHPYTTHVSELAFLLDQSVHSSPGDLLLPLGDAALHLRSPAPPRQLASAAPSSPPGLSAAPASPPRTASLPGAQEAQQALDAASGSVVHAAKRLGINRHQLHRLIRRHSLTLSRGSEKKTDC